MKKFWLPLLAIGLALLVLGGALVYLLIALPRLTSKPEEPTTPEFASVEDYLAENWTGYRFRSLEDGVLSLDYDLKGSFDQIQKHGAAAGYDAIAAGNLETAELIRKGCNMQCDVILREIVIRGVSEDGKQAYTASTLSGVSACWDGGE